MRAIDRLSMPWASFAVAAAALNEPAGARWLRRARDTIRLWHERSRGRQELLRLDEHVLRDIGVTRLQAEAEAYKPFWRA